MTPMTRTQGPVLRRLLLAAALVLLVLPAGVAGAADYFVVGRVYSATPLPAGEETPTNPLSAVPAEQVLGDDGLVATVPRNLVKVRVLAAADGSELGSFITQQDGGYLVSFSSPVASLEARFVIEELATSQQLLESATSTLAPAVNVRYPLVREEPAVIGDDRDFATAPAGALYTGLFTRVGKIEVNLIDSAGLANVPSAVSTDLAIPQYEDAPFGGNLYLFGALSAALYSQPNVCYKIRVYPDPAAPGFSYMTDPLVKTKYSANLATGTVTTSRETLGPKMVGGTAGCYELTPLSSSPSPGVQEFWSFPDLLALWRTGGLNGDYRLQIEVFGLADPGDFGDVDYTDLTLMLDNVAPLARIVPFQAGEDGPRVYLPSGAPGGTPAGADLVASLLGSFPADYGGGGDKRCEIFSLQPPAPTKYLAFKLTASHAGSFLRYWDFRYERNDAHVEYVLGKRYDGATNTMVDRPDARVSSAETSTGGFSDRFLYLDSNHLQPSGTALSGCGYRFVIRAATRTTDGYHYLRYSHDDDVHYVQK